MSDNTPLDIPGSATEDQLESLIKKQLAEMDAERKNFQNVQSVANEQISQLRSQLTEREPERDDMTLACLEILDANPMLREPALKWLRAMRAELLNKIGETLNPYLFERDADGKIKMD